MNRVIVRAVVFRSGFALLVTGVTFGVLMLMGAPWKILIPFVGLVAVLNAINVVLSITGDRRLAIRAGWGDRPWTTDRTYLTAATAPVKGEAAIALARKSLEKVGAFSVETLGDATLVAWIGVTFPLLPEYQLEIVIADDSDGGSSFACRARPRWRFNVFAGMEQFVGADRRSEGFAKAMQANIQMAGSSA